MKNLFLNIFTVTTLAFPAYAKLNVVVTTPDLSAIAKEIGGDKVEITTLARPTEDPHFVDAKPSFIVKLNRADVLIEGGAELEVGWLPALLEGSRNSKLSAGKPGRIACSEGISLLEVPSTLDRAKGDIHAAGNPHYMTDPANARIVAQHICNSLCQVDAGDCDNFKANLKKFQERIDAKMIEWQKLLIPYKGRVVVTYHNSWPYFARRFDLKAELFLEPKPGIPPTPSHLAEVIGRMKAENVKVIIVQPYQNRKTAEAVAGHTGATVLDFPTFPGKPAETYEDWMDGLVKSLAQALEGSK
ncbi:MAG: zinc ABC transporter substrate-binding protein [Verrucomicrobia bacterium]|nr:zinc ABC transporter substrate-binding protein [Verrucomicrobiota bacterium]